MHRILHAAPAALRIAVALLALLAAPGTAAAQGNGIAGVWRGSYTCLQGVTGLTLRIAGNGDSLTALFEFFADARNPGVPSGAFTMTGRYEAKSRAVSLRQERWVDQPAGYIMIDLDGTLSADGGTLSGRVAHESCTTFALARDAAK